MRWGIFFILDPLRPENVITLKLFTEDQSNDRYMAKPILQLRYPAGLVTQPESPRPDRLVIFDESGKKGLRPQQLSARERYRIRTLTTLEDLEDYHWAYMTNFDRKSILILSTTVIKSLSYIYIFHKIHLCKQVTSITTNLTLVLTHKNGF